METLFTDFLQANTDDQLSTFSFDKSSLKMTANRAVKFCFIFLLISLTKNAEGYRILGLFPHPGLSHFHFFHPIMRSLAEAGHEVTVVSSFPNEEPIENYKDEAMTDEVSGLTNSMNLEVRFVGFLNCPIYVNLSIELIVFVSIAHVSDAVVTSGLQIQSPMITC